MTAEIVVLPSKRAVADALADRTATALRAALAEKNRVTLCLTGGSTPVPAYQRLATAEGVDWARVHVFWGDERCVPPDHGESNFGMAAHALLVPAGVPETNVHKMPGACPPKEGAAVYEQALEQFFGDDLWFDVLHLGMGDDGHTASLFPGTPALGVTDRRVTTGTAPPSATVRDRLTLTLPTLGRAGLCLIAAAGAGKREAFADVLDAYDGETEAQAEPPPIARVEGTLIWLVDRDLATGLTEDDEEE
ncbi:6-phosphogluconolactonase [Rubrivirga sp.]|uniref:6-phosphogluconolactonase n=1 Tax=Rubrivirga sp. TaxID=1885344 RepID=UPI003B52DCF3